MSTIKEIEEKFDEEFVFIDTGADGDGYDAKPPEWNEYFSTLKEEIEQIDKIKSFYRQQIITLLEEIEAELPKKFNMKTLAKTNPMFKEYQGFNLAISVMRKKLNKIIREMK